ncbi:MAG: hypothetical protein IJ837_03265 [Clostridia bacterium]|nr:hypothetical protein [Clostridia bacterium]
MESNQRKLLSNFLISGTAVIVFSLLDAIKLVIYFVVDPMWRFVIEDIFNTNQELAWINFLLIFGFTIIEAILGCFVGFSARAEARGKRRNIFYVVVAIITAVVLGISSIFAIIQAFLYEISALSIIEAFISAGFSFVVVYALVDIIICSLKIRKLKKQDNGSKNDNKQKNEEVM